MAGARGRLRTKQFIQLLCLHMPMCATGITEPHTLVTTATDLEEVSIINHIVRINNIVVCRV